MIKDCKSTEHTTEEITKTACDVFNALMKLSESKDRVDLLLFINDANIVWEIYDICMSKYKMHDESEKRVTELIVDVIYVINKNNFK